MDDGLRIRRAEAGDADALLTLITALAHFEELPPPDNTARERLVEHGFGPDPKFEAWLVEVPDGDAPVGYALFFETYSTFLMRPTLYLEDIFVLPEHRGHGIGTALLDHCVGLARERGCGRVEWACLDWNVRAQAVYDRMGAKKMSEWLLYRLTGDALAETTP